MASIVKTTNSEKEEEHLRAHNVKKGFERLDRRSGSRINGGPKKGGHGGKYTWAGDRTCDLTHSQPAVTVLDHKDPNYEEEAF
ncbi:hypothetical protein SUGI_0668910 [Cryptomeria japonica]|nr:hypothetical protein SUGI_0668910 [Cryptomeria japonica]